MKKSKAHWEDWGKAIAYIIFVFVFVAAIVGIRFLIVQDHPECFWAQDVGTCMAISEKNGP